MVIGLCPTCGTELDHEELVIGSHGVAAFCCACSVYVNVKMSDKRIAELLERVRD